VKRSQDIEAWRYFLAVERAGTISGACDIVYSDPSTVSRTIHALEESLGGISLFDRSSRPFKLTDNGRIALEYARSIVNAHDGLIENIEKDFDAMKGSLRVGLPPILQTMMRDFLINFVRTYPDISLSVLEYRGAPPIHFDSPSGHLDIISAYGPDPAHDNIVQIHFGDGILIPCAAPSYLQRRGVPKHPLDLIHHRGVIYGNKMRSGIHTLSNGKETYPVRFGQSVFFDSGYTAVAAATIGGAGVNLGIPSVHAAREIASGRLVPVLTEWAPPPVHMYIYTRPEIVKFRRVRTFMDEYRSWLRKMSEETHSMLKGKIPDELLEKEKNF
jgi:DNA-binding transcriptional LysR family regulator